MNEERVAKALGWFSIGLGVAEVAAGRALGRWLGMNESVGVIQACGVREIATGIGIFAQQRPTAWVWGRVAGDAVDLAVVGNACRPESPKPGNAALAFGAVAAVTAVDLWCAWRLTERTYLNTRRHEPDESGESAGAGLAASIMKGTAR